MTFLLGLLKVLLWDVGQDEPLYASPPKAPELPRAV